MPSAWTRLRGALDPLARAYGQYTAYRLSAVESIGTTYDLTLDGARHYLRQNAYEPQYVSAAKRHPATDALHDLSYRYVPTRHPDAWPTDRFDPEECQYHVHVFRTAPERLDWFSHYEARPDPLRPWPSLRRLRTHYRPEYGRTYIRGVSNLSL